MIQLIIYLSGHVPNKLSSALHRPFFPSAFYFCQAGSPGQHPHFIFPHVSKILSIAFLFSAQITLCMQRRHYGIEQDPGFPDCLSAQRKVAAAEVPLARLPRPSYDELHA